MYKVDLPTQDTKDTARIEARRHREAQRASRIFDVKQRTVGLDLEALQAQVEEKKKREADERAYNSAMDAETLRHAKIIELLQYREEQDRKALAKADVEFRATQQLAHTRREYDLNDPAARTQGDVVVDEALLGASSLKVFAGEDAEAKERKRLQAEQQRQWLQQQRDYERAKKELEDNEKKAEELMLLQQQVALRDLSAAEEARRKQLVKETTDFNRTLAEAKTLKAQQEKEAELQQNLHEQLSTLQRLDETASPDRAKGMSDEQRRAFREAQLQQIDERKQAKEAEEAERAQHDRQTSLLSRTLQLHENEAARKRQELARQHAAENARMAAEQKARREHENKVAARNVVTDEFHKQFNRGSR